MLFYANEGINSYYQLDDDEPVYSSDYVNVVTTIHRDSFNSRREYEVWETNVTVLSRVVANAIEEALYGVKDGGVNDRDLLIRRAEALAFFVDGSYQFVLEYGGIITDKYPPGIEKAIKRVANRCRGYIQECPKNLDDGPTVLWCYERGYLDDSEIWSVLDSFRKMEDDDE